MTPSESEFVSLASDLIKNYEKDDMCKSCMHWNPHSVKLMPATCMNPYNDKLVTVFNPHGFNYSDLRQAMPSERNSTCKHYKFEKDKYKYLQGAIDDIKKKYEEKK